MNRVNRVNRPFLRPLLISAAVLASLVAVDAQAQFDTSRGNSTGAASERMRSADMQRRADGETTLGGIESEDGRIAMENLRWAKSAYDAGKTKKFEKYYSKSLKAYDKLLVVEADQVTDQAELWTYYVGIIRDHPIVCQFLSDVPLPETLDPGFVAWAEQKEEGCAESSS